MFPKCHVAGKDRLGSVYTWLRAFFHILHGHSKKSIFWSKKRPFYLSSPSKDLQKIMFFADLKNGLIVSRMSCGGKGQA